MEHGEAPTAGLKSPLLLETDQVQVTVAQGLSSKKMVHDTLKAKIKPMASVQTDQSTPQPVDTAGMGYRDGSEHVEAVGMPSGEGKGPSCGTSWTCGGNHCARSCPKGNSQVFGSCWTCGGNHFSRECPKGDAGRRESWWQRQREGDYVLQLWRWSGTERRSVRRRCGRSSMRRRRTEATAACRRVGTSAGWRRACGCSAANVGGVVRGGDGVCLLGFHHSCTARSSTRRRRPEDQIRPMDAAHWAGSDTQQSSGGTSCRKCTGERPASVRLS